MRLFRRFLVVVSGTSALMIVIVTIAMAVGLVPGTNFTGQTGHRHYTVNLSPECFTNGCTKATTIGVQVTTGNAKHPGRKCVYGDFQLPNAKLVRGSFFTKGQVGDVTRTYTVKVYGTFTTPTRVHGAVVGPAICGGKDRYRLTETPQAR
jgi:hypothetical protein